MHKQKDGQLQNSLFVTNTKVNLVPASWLVQQLSLSIQYIIWAQKNTSYIHSLQPFNSHTCFTYVGVAEV